MASSGLSKSRPDLKLRLGCSVFLSHSGADKDFVRFLHEGLAHKGYRVFYDEESLPKAVPVTMRNILTELKDVKLAVLVLSDEFFNKTQHPMSELATAVATKIQLLPIFYKFSVPQFKAKCEGKAWLQTWKRWVHEDVICTDTIREWEYALDVVSNTNGLEFCKEACNNREFRDKIVARVCQILKPDIRWSAQGLQGMDRLCQMVSQRFDALEKLWLSEPCNSSHSKVPFMILGMHGIAGIGKSSLCRALCDFFFQEFNGRVCHIELGDDSETAIRWRLECAYFWLTGSTAPLQHLSVQQVWNLLIECFEDCGSRPLFLAIDNVQKGASMDEALNYLGCHLPGGSKIFVTSTSKDVLSSLAFHAFTNCIEVISFPHLSFAEARNVFLCTLSRGGQNTLNQQQEYVVNGCVRMCTFNKLQTDYYPLMLVVLASYMLRIDQDPLQWKGKLKEFQRDGIFVSSGHRLDRIFKCAYDSLTEDERLILIDLALYLPDTLNRRPTTKYAKMVWLEPTYPNLQDVDQITSQLADLSLVESRDTSGINSEICFRVHDLLRQFVKYEVSKSSSRVFMEDQSVEHLRRRLRNRQHIERLGISNCQFEDATLDLSSIERIEVLHLIGNTGLECVRLSRMGWINLQSLVVQTKTIMKICVLEAHMEPQAFYLQLENCGLISEAMDRSHSNSGPRGSNQSFPCLHRGQMFPENSSNSGLRWSNVLYLNLYGVQMFEQREVCFDALPQLFVLKLVDLPDMRINLSLDKCPYIREISLNSLPNLEVISGLENSSNIASLSITKCNTLSSLAILDKCASYKVKECKALESIELHQSQLKDIENEVVEGSLSVFGCPLVDITGLSRRQFIGTVCYEIGTCEKSLECTPESLEHIFETSGDSIQQQIGTATVMQFKLKLEGLQELKLRHVQDLSSFLTALRRTSASSLEDLKIICSRHDDCGCDRLAHQPHFDNFKMGLKVLSYSCRRVKDLSSLGNCSSMELMCLYGCLSAVKWPDFGKMTSLETLIVESPGSLVYWPSGLQGHPSLDDLIINGSNQIPPEELVKSVTSMDAESHSRRDRLWSFAALEILVDDVYSSRKDKLCIAEALMSNSEKLLAIIDKMLSFTCLGGDEKGEVGVPALESDDDVFHKFEARKQLQVTNLKFFHLLSQLLYGLWVESDCNLHECSLTCGAECSQMELIQDCLRGLLSSKTMISALLLTIPEGHDLCFTTENRLYQRELVGWLPSCLPCKGFRSCYAYESLVLISFASIQRFKVRVEEEAELVNEIKHIVGSYFESWERNDFGSLPLLLCREYEVPDRFKKSADDFYGLIEHELSAARVAEAVWRLRQLTGINREARRRRVPKGARPIAQSILNSITATAAVAGKAEYEKMRDEERQRAAKREKLDARILETYGKYHHIRASFTGAAQYQDSPSVRKQWHHPVGCFCQLRRREDYLTCVDHIRHDYSVFSCDLFQLRH